MQSVPITTDVVSSNLDQGEVQHYVIKFVSDLRQVGGFLRVLRIPPLIKLTPRYTWNIAEHHQANKQTNIFKHICTILNIHSFFPYESVCLGYQTGSIKYLWANLCFICTLWQLYVFLLYYFKGILFTYIVIG